MRARRRCIGWAASFGVLALAVNALVPVHIAFDLAAALGAANDHALLAKLTGHHRHHADGHSHHHDGKPANDGKSSGPACAVCLTLATLAGFASAAVIALLPRRPATLSFNLAPVCHLGAAGALAYRSRAPPLV